MKNLDKLVQLFIQNEIQDISGLNIAVGYSAGADSTALLHILKKKSEHFGFTLTPVFFTHSNSPIADGEDLNLSLAKETCSKLNLNLEVINLELTKSTSKSWEELGREGRINYYSSSNFDYVFLGHHNDDQNETTMSQLFRGAGSGIVGMKKVKGIFCRPFLDIEKDDIYSFLIINNIKWIEDPTNKNSKFTRNFWRNRVLPLISEHYPGYKASLNSFREKNSNLNKIAHDMAIVDGLNDLISNNRTDIALLAPYRQINLINEFSKVIGSFTEDAKLKNFLKIGKATGQATLSLKKGELFMDNGELGFIPSLENKPRRKII